MTAPSLNLRARRAARAETQLARIRAFVADNRAELLRMMRIAAGEAGAADAEILLRLLAKPRPEIERVFGALSQMRDGLAEAESGVGFEERDARSDLDAAIRWHGARLDDLIGSVGR